MEKLQYSNLKLKKVEEGDLVNVFLEDEEGNRTHRGATIVAHEDTLVAKTSDGKLYGFHDEGVRAVGLAWDNRDRTQMTHEELMEMPDIRGVFAS